MYLVKQGNRTDYNYKEYYLDSKNELTQINIAYCCPGSIAYIIDTTDVYILNTKKQWILQGTNSGSGGGGSVNLQNKEITITENTTTNVVADNGYDGLGSVNIITNIEGSGDDELLNQATALVDEINGEVI